MQSFRVIYRNSGHWDIEQDGTRIFKIRGKPGRYSVCSTYTFSNDDKRFNTLQGCMGYIVDLLMHESIKEY